MNVTMTVTGDALVLTVTVTSSIAAVMIHLRGAQRVSDSRKAVRGCWHAGCSPATDRQRPRGHCWLSGTGMVTGLVMAETAAHVDARSP